MALLWQQGHSQGDERQQVTAAMTRSRHLSAMQWRCTRKNVRAALGTVCQAAGGPRGSALRRGVAGLSPIFRMAAIPSGGAAAGK